MATLWVTFGTKTAPAPLEDGEGCNTEALTIGASPQYTTTFSSSKQTVVTLLADADCYVVVAGKDRLGTEVQNSAAGSKRRPVQSGVEKQFAIGPEFRVGCLQR